MTATTMAAQAVRRRSAMTQLTITELKLFTRGRAGVGLGVSVGFPLLLLIVFGSIHSFSTPVGKYGGLTTLDVYVPILLVFAMALLSLVAMPATLAGYRELGVLRRLQTTPAGPGRLLAAQLGVNVAVSAFSVIVLILAVAWRGYGVVLPRQLAGFAVATLLTIAALLAIGLFVAAIAPSAQAAQAIGMILLYPLMFFAGLFYPIPALPAFVQHLSHATPLGAAVQALQVAFAGQWPQPQQLLTLAAYAVVFGLAAARFFRWE